MATEAVVHVPPLAVIGGFGRWPAGLRRDDRPHAQVQPRDAVVGFRVVTRVGHALFTVARR